MQRKRRTPTPYTSAARNLWKLPVCLSMGVPEQLVAVAENTHSIGSRQIGDAHLQTQGWTLSQLPRLICLGERGPTGHPGTHHAASCHGPVDRPGGREMCVAPDCPPFRVCSHPHPTSFHGHFDYFQPLFLQPSSFFALTASRVPSNAISSAVLLSAGCGINYSNSNNHYCH